MKEEKLRSNMAKKADTGGYNLGASIIYTWHVNRNLLSKEVRRSSEPALSNGSKNWEESLFINPGLRFALKYRSGLRNDLRCIAFNGKDRLN